MRFCLTLYQGEDKYFRMSTVSGRQRTLLLQYCTAQAWFMQYMTCVQIVNQKSMARFKKKLRGTDGPPYPPPECAVYWQKWLHITSHSFPLYEYDYNIFTWKIINVTII